MEETIDPTVKLSKLVRENNYEDAFNMALSLGDVAIVSWLCDQVGLSLFMTVIVDSLQGNVAFYLEDWHSS